MWSFSRLPIDATPDITNVQVQVNTEAPGYSPLEAEQRVTFVIETAIAGLPNLDYTRSLSRYGLSQVTVVFEDGTDIFFARQQVAERIAQVKSQLPPGLEPELGPIATGMGEIFLYTVTADPSARARRPALECDGSSIAPRLGGASATAQYARCYRSQRDWRICTADPCYAGSGTTARVWVLARRRGRRSVGEQPERQRRLYRTQWAAAPGSHSEPGAGHRRRSKPSCWIDGTECPFGFATLPR